MDDTLRPVDPKKVRISDQALGCKDSSEHEDDSNATTPKKPTVEEVRQVILEMAVKRWLSKSKAKRKALLSKAWPDMPPTHRPDIETWQSLHNGHPLEDKDTLALMWPSLNVEDLSNKETLLLMLHQRARYPPHEFSVHDIGLLNFGTRTGLIGQIELPGYFAILRDRNSPETYGKLYAWSDDIDGVMSEPTRGWFTPSDSYWAVLVQAHLFWFLNRICQLILHDMSKEEIYPAQGSHLLSQDFPYHLSRTNIEGVKILAIEAFEDQYKAPRAPNFGRTIRLIGAKLAHVEDHLWALREDPNYFINAARDRMEHMTEMVPDEDGNPGPPPGLGRNKLWARVFQQLITEAIANVNIFNVLFEKICRVNCLVAVNSEEGKLPLDKKLSDEMNEAVFEAFHCLVASSWELLVTSDLESSASSSPLFRDSFYREQKESALGHPLIRPRTTIILDCVRDRLMWIFNNLSTEHNRFDLGVRGLVAELDLYVRQEPKARALITPFVAGLVSTLGISCECLYQYQFFQPWIGGYRTFFLKNADRLQKNWLIEHTHHANLANVKQDLWERMARLPKINSKGEYVLIAQDSPILSKGDIIERQVVEAHHDRFWTALLRGLRAVGAVSVHLDALMDRDKLKRTAPYVEPVKAAKEEKKKSEKIPVDRDDQILDEAIAQNKKLGQKEEETVDESSQEEEVETIEVSKRALKVFRAILFDGLGSYELTKGIQWNDFVYALMSIGFRAEKLFGSGWIFSPDMGTMGFAHPIYFEEPQNGGEINYLVMKHYGRRMRRTYGYKREMFKLAAPQPKEAKEG
ncbi:uncharacterized protein GGS22DRAFT_194190 [Annulohypoxylon maeteangense]|uniref:uncharacterized protein n=1 Tax=Annulohypoxylon maeteangense TaxID=1927788 RepID=UPI002008674C|nr:uncharacterized protein GGS22DRAFT_194190 [Annulohypoxylon maeteangense]KAI0889849.1 hypothetical protein GGS22DRAFT_194190 [Annulohypoxylon maeteangense]